jgi:hypothetical protein
MGRSRSLEPSVHDNGDMYALLASCLRVLLLATSPDPNLASTTCAVANEACCIQKPEQNFGRFWSLENRNRTDAVISNDEHEKDWLTKWRPEGSYKQMCTGIVSGDPFFSLKEPY